MYSYRLGRTHRTHRTHRTRRTSHLLCVKGFLLAQVTQSLRASIVISIEKKPSPESFCVPARCLNDSGFFVDLGRGTQIDEELRLHFSASVYTRTHRVLASLDAC